MEFGVLEQMLATEDDLRVERGILGTAVPEAIAELVSRFCLTLLSAEAARILFFETSQGAVFGVELADRRRVVIKVFPGGQDAGFLASCQRVQVVLCSRGFPCPRPVLGPSPFAQGLAIVEEMVDIGKRGDAHDAGVRGVMARSLARLHELGGSMVATEDRWLRRAVLPPDRLWPVPHSPLFDFDRTARGAEWIDERARWARQVLEGASSPRVVTHLDWSVKHFRFLEGRPTVIYDWDSLAVERETITVGEAARGFTATWYLDVPVAPSVEEARAFVGEYESARGAPFTGAERMEVAAAAVRAMAYTARCEHALGTEVTAGSFREALASFGPDWLEGKRP